MANLNSLLVNDSVLVTYELLTSLTPFSSDARTHSKKQIKQIADSILEFKFTNPILIDGNNQMIVGHGRAEAAKLLGMTKVPTIRLNHLTKAQIRAYVIADNKLAQNAGWDNSILAIELQHLLIDGAGLEVTITGFEIAEIDVILEEAQDES
jgi:ParB-like chromosome segregation protein Spo0J